MTAYETFQDGNRLFRDDLYWAALLRYRQAAEAGLNPRDPALAIDWPLEIGELSARDGAHPMVAQGFAGIAP